MDDDSGGDITAVSAGAGLTGGGTTGSVTLAVNVAGSGSAVTVARSDHDHLGQSWSGSSPHGLQVSNSAAGGLGVVGWATASSGENYGVWGESASTSGFGVVGLVPALTGTTYGVGGESWSTTGRGVWGLATATTGLNYGVLGESASESGTGVRGNATATAGTGNGVWGESAAPGGNGVYGVTPATTGLGFGVWGVSYSTGGAGVVGEALAATGTTKGVWGSSSSSSGIGVYGAGPSFTGTTVGVQGESFSTAGTGVYGRVFADSGEPFAVLGIRSGAAGWAGYFVGPVGILGSVSVSGTVSKGGGSFKIDHPLDPENKYLYHSFVESPDMMNVYNGNVTTDAKGYAVVQLPDWFEALNRDFRYQLTVIGAGRPGPWPDRGEDRGQPLHHPDQPAAGRGLLAGHRHPPGRLCPEAPDPRGGGQARKRAGPVPPSRGVRPAEGEGSERRPRPSLPRDPKDEGGAVREARPVKARIIGLGHLLAALAAAPAFAQTYELAWWTVDGGGAMGTTGVPYALSGTAGQPDAGPPATGGTYAIAGGFWPATLPGEPAADLSLLLTDSPDPVVGLQSLTYTFAVSNAGPDAATAVSVSDPLPAGTLFESAGGSGWTCGESAGLLTCTRPTLAVGPAPALTLVVRAPAAAATLSNTAGVSAAESDPLPGNNSDTETTTVTAPPGPTATVSGDAVICPGRSTTIQAALTGTPPWSLTWSDSVVQAGILATPATRSVSPLATTTYTVTAVSDAGGPGTSGGSGTVTLNPACAAFYTLTPCRVADTRGPSGPPVVPPWAPTPCATSPRQDVV